MITIAGSNFRPDSLDCTFGSSVTSPATFVSSTEIRCVAPPMSKGNVVVDVLQAITAGNGTSTSSASLVVQPAGVLKGVEPAAGMSKGGGAVLMQVSQLHSDVKYSAHIGTVIIDAVVVGNDVAHR